MNSLLILFFIISIVISIVCYIVTNSWIPALIVLLASTLYFYLYAYPKIKKHITKNKSFHSCYTFINTFIISLSVKGSLLASFEATRLSMDQDYLTIIDGLTNLKEEERLDYLKRYYNFDIYYLFLGVIKIYVEQGGDIFNIAHYLIEDIRRKEDYLINVQNILKRKIVAFSVLWSLTLLILIILRFALNAFYHIITKNLLFLIAVTSLFLLLLLSLHLFILKATNDDIRGYRNV